MALTFTRRPSGKRLERPVREILPVTEKLLIALDQRAEFGVVLASDELHLETQ
ncbi:hypothetical protein MKK69_21720 [Methylobacterium sp. J-026]|uniref:hypothetical protein n=1 Tax=Methylobacterium sp. J-026 TaxID=2836624 RepID=UPI001FBA9DE1|nr:hypothetical protein [Methylobacterium sp. J-026]MCJ2136632.1 hypothetical protein [Methylobacterium sp. J-026]